MNFLHFFYKNKIRVIVLKAKPIPTDFYSINVYGYPSLFTLLFIKINQAIIQTYIFNYEIVFVLFPQN